MTDPDTFRKRVNTVGQRQGFLLVPVPGLSGTVYPVGTAVSVSGRGASVDAFVGGDWLPLAWWEFSDQGLEESAHEL
jgi:hypothetical protein